MSLQEDTAPDLVDRALGLSPDDPLFALRRSRDKVTTGLERCRTALFDANAADGFTVEERALVAYAAATICDSPALLAEYRKFVPAGCEAAMALIDSGDIDRVAPPRLAAILHYTRVLLEKPVEGNHAAIAALQAAGLGTAEIVALSQLVAYLSFETRVVAGLRAFHASEICQ